MPIEDLVGGKRFAEINLEKSQKNDTFVTENEDNGDTNTEQPEKIRRNRSPTRGQIG